jgi:hypothetical protein
MLRPNQAQFWLDWIEKPSPAMPCICGTGLCLWLFPHETANQALQTKTEYTLTPFRWFHNKNLRADLPIFPISVISVDQW